MNQSNPSSPSLGAADDLFSKGALLYAKGKYSDAAYWFSQAAVQGHADAQFMLGNMFRDGQGVAKDWDQALDWYIKAAAQGHAEAKQAMRQATAAAPAPVQPTASHNHAVPNPAVPSLCDTYANKQVGECLEFGRYPQGPEGEIEPIIWRVLQREEDHLLVIAEQGLVCKQFDEGSSSIGLLMRGIFNSVNWENCTLRSWLKDEFINEAFNEQEHKCILPTSVINNAGPNTEDLVFLLSVDEANSLFANEIARCAKATEYAVEKGAWIDDDNGYCRWWLRSRGDEDGSAALVNNYGGVLGKGALVYNVDNSVRPALKLAL